MDSVDTEITITDKYARRSGRIFLSGTQALVRLPLLQRDHDLARGFNTAGFVSGYRGSPLAQYDMELWRAKAALAEKKVYFQPGLNEEQAATAVWGTQQIGFQPGANVDGVFSIWYAKGPGVDRSMDALKHANSAGTAALGGVLAVFGDDHGAQSSTMLYQSEQMFEAAGIPVLNPADLEDIIAFGLHGFELSRFAGCWVGLKATTEVIESTASIEVGALTAPVVPADYERPADGLGIRWPDTAAAQEQRVFGTRLDAVAAFARANPIDRIELASGAARLGIATTGKAYLDVLQALRDLGIGPAEAGELGLRVYKIGMTWPLEVIGARRFADGLEEILVVEEKRAFIEPQFLRALQFSGPKPRIVGKSDEVGQELLPGNGVLNPPLVAVAIIGRLRNLGVDVSRFEEKLLTLKALIADRPPVQSLERRAFFCSGCPHNSSTKVPDGSRAIAGTGCHYMAITVPDRHTSTHSHMGGEGVTWIGLSPFAKERHVFVNLGDGTYSHSGTLAIRAASAAGVNVTYKILYNDAVAMTGGQPNDAHVTVSQIAHQVRAEGAKRVVILAEDVSRHDPRDFPSDTDILDRSNLDRIQRELRETPGLTVLIYDQVCAAEKRRRRKRKQYPAALKRVFINDAVCEDCGDCSAKSNCISVAPIQTPLGRKRIIDQSSCNADYSCLQGFCPSFVTVRGGVPRSTKADVSELDAAIASLPMPVTDFELSCNILIAGIGGTGVITVGAVIGMAAHIEGKAVTILDFTGLAQKNGGVTSHVRIAPTTDTKGSVRIPAQSADLLIACDPVVSASPAALSRIGSQTHAVMNTYVAPPAAFVLDPTISIDGTPAIDAIRDVVGDAQIDCVDATGIATRLCGDSIFTNLFVLGFAWQRGTVPLRFESLMRAIALNGTEVALSKRAFALGRLAAVEPQRIHAAAGARTREDIPSSIVDIIADRRSRLVDYQNEAYATRYEGLVRDVDMAERKISGAPGKLTEAVARNFYKLMAYKDEYEVARLYAEGDFRQNLDAQFETYGRLEVHLAPPLLARRDRITGVPRKIAFGPWVLTAFRLLARLKGLRGTAFDIFGYTHERRMERSLVTEYEETVRRCLVGLSPQNLATVTELAEVPSDIRGYGHVKDRNAADAAKRRDTLLGKLKGAAAEPASDIRVRTEEGMPV